MKNCPICQKNLYNCTSLQTSKCYSGCNVCPYYFMEGFHYYNNIKCSTVEEVITLMEMKAFL